MEKRLLFFAKGKLSEVLALIKEQNKKEGK